MAAQSYSTGINQQNSVRLFRYSDWLPRSPREKYFKNDNFLTQFCLLLSVECFGHILRKSVKSTYPINFLKVDTFYKKSNVRFTLKKICKQLTLPQEIMSPLETANQWRNRTSWHQLRWVRISREKCCSCKEHLGFLQQQIHIPSLPQKTASDLASKLSIELIQIDNTLVLRVACFKFSVISFI